MAHIITFSQKINSRLLPFLWLFLLFIGLSSTAQETQYKKEGQNKIYNTSPNINYVHEYIKDLEITVSLDILYIKDIGNTEFYGFNQGSEIPSNWGFRVINSKKNIYEILSSNKIKYTGLNENTSIQVRVEIYDNSLTSKPIIFGLEDVKIEYRIVGRFTIVSETSNSCTATYNIVVNEHTENKSNLSKPYTVKVLQNNVLLSGYPYTQSSNEISLSELVPEDYRFEITNILGQTVTGVFTIHEAYTPIASVTFAGFECSDSEVTIVDIKIEGAKEPLTWEVSSVISGITVGSDTETGFDSVGLSIIIPNLQMGQYTFTFEDGNGCGDTLDFKIVKPSEISLIPEDLTHVSCPQGENGTLKFTASGGWTEPFEGNIFNEEFWGDEYDFKLIRDTQSYTPKTSPNIYKKYNNDSPRKIIGWFAEFTDLPSGTYELLITEEVATNHLDNNISYSCSKTFGNFTITEPPAFFFNEGQEEPLCNEDSNGSTYIKPIGGTPPYQVSWYTGNFNDENNPILSEVSLHTDSGNIISDQLVQLTELKKGNYAVSIEDANNCIYALNFTLNEPNELLISEKHTSILCFGDNTGDITIKINNESTPDYVISLSGTDYLGQNVGPINQIPTDVLEAKFSNLKAGTYIATVTDANNCIKEIKDIIIEQPTAMLAIGPEVATQISCFNASDGAISPTVTGGTENYTYSWTSINGKSFSILNINNLAPDTYTLEVTDTNNCSVTKTYTIKQLVPLSVTASISNYNGFEVSSASATDGTITLNTIGGTQTYTYDWTTSGGSGLVANDTNQKGLSAGTYTVEITDANDCTTTESFTLTAPLELKISHTKTDILCFGQATGGIEVTVTQGSIANYTYSIYGTLTKGGIYYTSATTATLNYSFKNLEAGIYNIKVTDANNYLKEETAIKIEQPTAVLAIGNETASQISCFNASDGAISPSVTGGTENYTYSWSSTIGTTYATLDISGLAPATYTLLVTDTNKCTTSETYTISQPNELLVSGTKSNYTGFNVSSASATDGTITLNTIGGTQAFTYDWTTVGGSGLIVNDTNQTELSAGTYTVEVTDKNNCTATKTFILTAPNELEISHSTTDVLCFGEATGEIKVNIAQESIANYTYSISGTLTKGGTYNNSATTAALNYNFKNLEAGIYKIAVRDANNYMKENFGIIINQPTTSLTIGNEIASQISCFNASDGAITPTVTGGTKPYTYSWTSIYGKPFSSLNISNLPTDTYTLKVTDANNCSITKTYTIPQPDALVITATISNYNDFEVSSSNATDGNITISIAGGTQGYTYFWSTADGSEIIETAQNQSGLTTGIYTVIVTDVNNCTATETFTLTAPFELLISQTEIDLKCFGNGTGEINVKIDQESIKNYTFLIYGEQLSGGTVSTSEITSNLTYSFKNLQAGTYKITVTDANEYFKNIDNIIITQPTAILAIGNETVTQISCYNVGDGSITNTVTGGSEPYTYSWTSPGGFTSNNLDIDKLSPDEYLLTVTDTNNCTTNKIYTITEPDLLEVTGTKSDYNTFNVSNPIATDGEITLNIKGGKGTYTYLWTIANGVGIVPTAKNQTGLGTGTYSVEVTDENNCTATETFILTAPLALEISQVKTDVLCFGNDTGEIVVTVYQESIAPYGITINGTLDKGGIYNKSTSTPDPSYTFTNLYAGNYKITVTDANGSWKEITSIIISQPTASLTIASEKISQITCFEAGDGSISVVATGGVGDYTYNWTGPIGFSPSTASDIQNLHPGEYILKIKDTNAICELTKVYTITQPDTLVITETLSNYNDFNVSSANAADGSITLLVNGGTEDYTYQWTTTGSTENIATDKDQVGLTAGTYTVIVTDDNDCSETEEYTLIAPLELKISQVPTDVLCFGEATGEIEVKIEQESIAPFTYSIYGTTENGITYNDSFSTSDLNYNFTDLEAGTYNITVTDANNYYKEKLDIIITQPITGLAIGEETAIQITCNGFANGSISPTITGGAKDYTYAWTSTGGFSATNLNIANLSPDEYTLTITDNNGCSTFETYIISQPDALVINETLSLYNGFNISCNGATDGTIDLAISGGSLNYYYKWSTISGSTVNSTAKNQRNLSAGEYQIIVTDDNNCELTKIIILKEPSVLIIEETHTNNTCFSDAKGTINIQVTQESVADYICEITGTDFNGLPYTDTQILVNGTYTFENLLAGTYALVLTDANACFESLQNIEITQPDAAFIIQNFDLTDVDCNGNDNGSIELTVTGGTPNFTFAWTGPNNFTSISENIYNLIPGDYSVIILDASKICKIKKTYSISAPDLITIIGVISDFNGFGLSSYESMDGSIDVTISGGVENYILNWTSDDGMGLNPTSEDQTGLAAGTYTLLVTDKNNCTEEIAFEITQPKPLLISTFTENIACFEDNNGSITVNIDQESVADYSFTISGTDYLGNIYTNSLTQKNKSHTFNNLFAGTYKILVQDANASSKTIENLVVLQPSKALEITGIITQNISCKGSKNGSIDIEVDGGTPNYKYEWTGPNGFSEKTQDISKLAPGNYHLLLMDKTNICKLEKLFIVTEPEALTAVGEISNYNGYGVKCNAGNDGFIKMTINGGTEKYTYDWTTLDGSGIIQNNKDQENLTSGTYQVIISDSQGCVVEKEYVITAPIALTIKEQHSNVVCFGTSEGSITITLSPSIASFTYTLTGIDYLGNPYKEVQILNDITYTFKNLKAGGYTVEIQDANGCGGTITNLLISQPLEPITLVPTFSNYNGIEISCKGADDGKIAIDITGGTTFPTIEKYIVNWTGPNNFSATSKTIENLEPGTYLLEIIDALNCTLTQEFEIREPTEISIKTDVLKMISCFGNNDGLISITTGGGIGTHQYVWTKDGAPFSLTQDISNLEPGMYVISITDSNNCSIDKYFEIIEPALMQLNSLSTTDILCYGDATGSINIEIIGGTKITSPSGVLTYNYSWTGPNGYVSNHQNLDKLIAGEYSLIVTDNRGCKVELSTEIKQPEKVKVLVTTTNITCYQAADGTINLTVTGGIKPYTYSWSNLGNGASQTDLNAGMYSVTITDNNNCFVFLEIEIIQAPIFTIYPEVNNVSCYGQNDGNIDLNLVGGVPPLTIKWSDNTSAGLIRNNLKPGKYTVEITENSEYSCSIIKTFNIIEPMTLTLDASVKNADDCEFVHSGAIDLDVYGGTPPYTFNWSNGIATEDLSDIPPGAYGITVTDINGCEASETYTVSRPEPLKVSINSSYFSDCDSKYVSQESTVTVSGGVPPYIINWTSGTISGDNNQTSITHQNGSINIDVTDAIGCRKDLSVLVDLKIIGDPSFEYSSYSIANYQHYSQHDPIQFTNTSTGDYTKTTWDFGDDTPLTFDINPIHTYKRTGSYTITQTVEYPYGCIFVNVIDIEILKAYELILPTAFTPNGDGINDTIRPVFRGFTELEFSVFDTWGKLIYTESGLNLKGWDGMIAQRQAENGNYVIIVKGVTFYGKELVVNNSITLIN